MEYIKKDEKTLIERPLPKLTVGQEHEYNLDFLKEQELQILRQIKEYNILRNKELANIRTLLIKAEELGIKDSATLRAEAIEKETAELEIINPPIEDVKE